MLRTTQNWFSSFTGLQTALRTSVTMHAGVCASRRECAVGSPNRVASSQEASQMSSPASLMNSQSTQWKKMHALAVHQACELDIYDFSSSSDEQFTRYAQHSQTVFHHHSQHHTTSEHTGGTKAVACFNSSTVHPEQHRTGRILEQRWQRLIKRGHCPKRKILLEPPATAASAARLREAKKQQRKKNRQAQATCNQHIP